MYGFLIGSESRSWRVLLITAVVGFGFGCGSSGPQLNRVAPAGVDISGRWVLNERDSDNPMELARRGPVATQDGAQQTPSAGGRGGGRRGGGVPTGGAVRRPPDEAGGMRATMRLAFRSPAILVLDFSDSTAVLAEDGNPPLALRTDGRKLQWISRPTAGPGFDEAVQEVEVETVAGWDERSLIVLHEVAGGGKIARQYLPSPTGDLLLVITAVDLGRGEPMQFRSVYQR